MKRILQFLVFTILFINPTKFFAQLDREHWFAPMIDRTGLTSTFQTLYLSTNEVTPFKVDVYSNNLIVQTLTISKNNPGKYNVPRSYIIATSTSDLFKPGTRGLYLKGDKPFFSSLRFSVRNHGEIITSKGTAGIGSSFRAVMAPIMANNSILNFMTSILATEDNTTVTINGFNPSVVFSDGVSRTQLTFTLNKGQSYIIDGRGDNTQNWDGFIGAKIVSDKPISITNGNFNGQYATNSTSSSDILMDQGVPEDKLGKEFILMKGNGNLSVGMEKALIVAVEDNTQIYLNGSGAPVATINAGQFFLTPNNAYILQGSNHYNMLVNTNKNVYVYQLLAGASNTSEVATGGFNYIPPLSCYLPKKIDEIGLIQENYVVSNGNPGGILDIPTKLNIITEKGATVDVKRNGTSLTLTSANGPFNVTGSSNWVTYSIPNVTDNIAVFSSSAVTAGISAGDDAVGYGGYFAGFSSIPLILKIEGECLPGVKIAVTEGFDSYQWLIKDAAGNYSPAPGVNNTFNYEPTQAGIYAAKLKQGSCPEIQTADYKFYNCTTYTNSDYEVCSTINITPAFSLSTQTLSTGTVKIDTPPTKGTVVINPDGTVTYTANAGATGLDTFKYSFCGIGILPDCETAQASITINQVVAKDDILRECSSNGTATYDLSKANVTADTSATKVYYKSLSGAQNQTATDVINNFTAYTTADTTVYVRITNAKTCFAIQKIELKSKANPVVTENLYATVHCDEEDGIIDGNYVVNPVDITPKVLTNPSAFIVRYYDSKAKADAGGSDNITGSYVFTSATAKIWIRVESAESCVTVKEIQLIIGSKIPFIKNPLTKDICDKAFDNVETINLADYIPELTSQTGVTVAYYKTMADALSAQNPISATQTLSLNVTDTFYFVIKNASFCADVATVNLKLIAGGFASTTLPTSPVTICEDATTQLDAGTAHTNFKWYNETDPTTVIATTQKVTLPPGKYFVILVSGAGCEYKQSIEIIGSPKAILNTSLLNSTYCDEDFDGKINFKFSTEVTPQILQNSNLYTVNYYSNAAMTTQLPDNWSYTTATRVYVKVTSPYCGVVSDFIDFKIGAKIPILNSQMTVPVCDDNLDGIKTVTNLNDFDSYFTNDPTVAVKYFATRANAAANVNPVTEISVNQQRTIYLRFSQSGICSSLAELKLEIKIPKSSTTLKDQVICPDTTTILDAGNGFDYYEWSTGEVGTTKSTISVGPGEYWVNLTYENCTYKQNVIVKAAELPEIKSIEIQGSTVTVTATGGKKPYQYALDGGQYQTSNVFTNIAPGLHTIYVISADNCIPVSKEFSVIEIYNVITPNGDGVNDKLDLSLLKYKLNVKFYILDRNGVKIFDGTVQNNYVWDGKQNGKTLPTSSYWYNLEWQDFENSIPVKHNGWILLKNRSSE